MNAAGGDVSDLDIPFRAAWEPKPASRRSDDPILLVSRPGGDVLVPRDAPVAFPDESRLEGLPGRWDRLGIGTLGGRPVVLVSAPPGEEAPEGTEWSSPRPIFASLDAGRLEALCRASMLASWDYDHRYCGRCGTPTRRDPKEAARVCPSCAFRSYPRVSPAMIVRITDGRRILLAHNRRFPGGVFSCVAGYVDPGESLEATVLREIKEEVGLDAAPPRYLSSQAWPFPHSLMLGFATTASGEPVPDGVEITDARWFDPEDLPHIPRRGTISRRIIDLWLDEIGVPSPPDRYW